MSEPENFLARWSRRKAEAERPAEAAPEPVRAEPMSPATIAPDADTEAMGGDSDNKEEAAVDLSKLPSLDSIGPGSDISAFLQKGVPGDLARAALRRVWTADPAIRDFIGIAENQYDFATGSDIPGFGPLTPADDVARMVAQITREGVPRTPELTAEDKSAENKAAPAADGEEKETTVAPAEEMEEGVSAEHAEPVQIASVESDVAPQQKEDDEPAVERSHGRALPR